MSTDMMTFLTWLAGGAGAMIAVSFVAERIAAFHNLTSQARGLIILGASVVVGLGSLAFLTYVPATVLAAIDPYFKVLAVIVAGWIASQWGHSWDPVVTSAAAAGYK